jgi:F0F1-type ATP synthase delta subunit
MSVQTITITSAVAIPDDLKQTLETKVTKKIGNFPIAYELDSSLIAGLQIRFGDTEYHYDLKSEIEYLTSELV